MCKWVGEEVDIKENGDIKQIKTRKEIVRNKGDLMLKGRKRFIENCKKFEINPWVFYYNPTRKATYQVMDIIKYKVHDKWVMSVLFSPRIDNGDSYQYSRNIDNFLDNFLETDFEVKYDPFKKVDNLILERE